MDMKDSKDASLQLTISKSSTELFFFKDLLEEIKYQITLTVLLRKYKENRHRESAPVYFNSATKTIINSKYYLDKYFQEIFNRSYNLISQGCGWIIEIMINMSIFLFIVHYQEVHTLSYLTN